MKEENFNFIAHCADEVHAYLPDTSNDVSLFIACQFALESNYGKSDLFQKNNNICGMKVAKVRPSLGSSVTSSPYQSFAYYPFVYLSIIDYVYWLCFHRITKEFLADVSKYCQFLVLSKYCPENDYISKIQSIYQQFKSYQND